MTGTDISNSGVSPAQRPVRDASPLSYGEFRVLWLSSVFTGLGFISEMVILGWLLLDLTDSALAVGAGVALRSLPNFLLGIPGGALADRFDRRSLLRLTGLASAGIAGMLGGLVLAGEVAVWQILLCTFAGGATRALGQGARQSYAFDVVGPERVVSGLAYMNLGSRAGGIVASIGAGAIIETWGAGEAYLAIAACHVLSSLAIAFARTRGQMAPTSRPPVWQGVKEYLHELQVNRLLATLVLLTAAVEVSGFSHMAALPSLARESLDLGPEGLGLLNAFASLGAIVATITVSLRGEITRKGVGLLTVLLTFGAALVLLGNVSTLGLGLFAICLVGAMASLSDLLTQSLVQTSVANDLRGRATGSWVLATGLGPLGHLQVGGLIAIFSVTAALTVNGALLVTLAAGALLLNRQIRRL